MQRWIPVFALIATLSPATAQAQSEAEIEKVAKLLDGGAKRFQELVARITDEQWNYRPAGVAHTLGEEIEHVTLSEHELPRVVDRALQNPAEPGLENPAKVDELREFFLGAESKAENFKSQNKIVNRAEYKELFGPAHDRMMAKLRNSKNLSQHFFRVSRFGKLSGLQLFYYMAFHRERHIRQMEALLAHPDMPGSQVSAD